METILFYPVYLLIVFVLSLIYIPKRQYKEYLIYGLLTGALVDIALVGFLSKVLRIMWFKNQGIFEVLGQHYLSPPSWAFTVMLYLYFLPRQRWFQYGYILLFAWFSFSYGLMVRNCDLYDFKPLAYYIGAPFAFLGWWIFVTWFFLKTSPLAKKEDVP